MNNKRRYEEISTEEEEMRQKKERPKTCYKITQTKGLNKKKKLSRQFYKKITSKQLRILDFRY